MVSVFATSGTHLPCMESKSGYMVFRPFKLRFAIGRLERVVSVFGIFILLCRNLTRIDIVHCNDLEPLPFCVLLKTFTFGRLKIIYDAHELETEKTATTGIRQLISRVLESFLIKRTDAFITVSFSIARWYEERYGLKLVEVVLNCPSLWNLSKKNSLRRELGIGEDVQIVLYQGGFMPGRHLEELLDAFRIEDRSDRVLVFLGHAVDKPESRAIEKAIRSAVDSNRNVLCLPSVSPELLSEYTASADIGISLIEDVCLSYRYCLPNKFFEFAMAGLPIVVSDLPEMRRMVEDYNCGVVCSSVQPRAILRSIDALLLGDFVQAGLNARRMAEENSWERQEHKLLALYDKII